MKKVIFISLFILVLTIGIFIGFKLDVCFFQEEGKIIGGELTTKEDEKNEDNKIALDSQVSLYKNLIKLYEPLPETEITSPLLIRGEARGSWFFEGDFPVILTDWDGIIIAQGVAQAQTDWMTEGFVPFQAELKFEKPSLYNRGALILKRDNPSGLPQNDDAYEITIYFK